MDDVSRIERLCCHAWNAHMARGDEVKKPKHRQGKVWRRSCSKNGYCMCIILGQRGRGDKG